MDYLQALPFMNYTKGVLSDFARSKTVIRGRVNSLSDDLYKRMTKNPEMAQAMKRTSEGIIDHTINKAARKVFSDPQKQVKFAHVSDFIANKLGKFVPLSISEAEEEGIQYLLQNRYQSGQYDDYNRDSHLISASELFDDARLAIESALAYWGLDSAGLDIEQTSELKKAMDVGGFTGMFFGSPHVLSNILPQSALEKLNEIGLSVDPSNTRNLIRQLKNDNVINKLVGENYSVAQDDQHAGIFFDAYSKAGMDVDGIVNALQRLSSVDEVLDKDKYVQRDIDIAKDVWNAYNSNSVNQLLSEIGATRDSQTHKDLVLLATRAVEDRKTAAEKWANSIEELRQFENDLSRQVLYGADVNSENPGFIEKLQQTIQDLYEYEQERYKQHLNQHRIDAR